MARFLGSSLRGFLEDCAAHEREVLELHHLESSPPPVRTKAVRRARGRLPGHWLLQDAKARFSELGSQKFHREISVAAAGLRAALIRHFARHPGNPRSHCIVREGRPCAGPK